MGDSYARVYGQDKVGVTDLLCDEMVLPPLVQPFEQGSKTVGYVGSELLLIQAVSNSLRCKW